MTQWENVWSFETARFCVALDVKPCDEDPSDHFQFDDDVAAVMNGEVMWFDARVRVLTDHCVIGEDHLGGCAYRSVNEFRHGGGYFFEMVREAIRDARQTARRLRDIHGVKPGR